MRARSCGIAGIKQIEEFGLQSTPLGEIEQALDRDTFAGILETDRHRVQAYDGLGGGAVHPLRGVVVVIVAEVGADHDQSLRTTQSLSNTSAIGVNHHQRGPV